MTGPEAVSVRDAALAVGRAVDELREGYFSVAAVLDQVGAAGAGSRHPLLARSRRRWDDGLAQANRAEQAITAGLGHLRQVSGVRPVGSIGDVVAALTQARARVDRVTVTVGRLRDQVEAARMALLGGDGWGPEVEKAVDQWRRAGEHLDLMAARLQVGVAALCTYAEGVSENESGPSREARLAGLLPHTRGPAGEVLAGAAAAGRLVATRLDHWYAPTQPAARPRTPCRRLLLALRHPRSPLSMWPPGGAWPGGVDAKFCAWSLLRLLTGDVRGYERWLHRIAARNTAHVYAGYLAAAFLLAVERRFRPGQDATPINRCVTTARNRYDPDGTALHPAVAGWLIRVALGEPEHDRDRPAGPARLVAAQTVLLVSLLVDEGLGRDELDDFLAEAGRMAASRAAGPALGEDRPVGQATGDTRRAERESGEAPEPTGT